MVYIKLGIKEASAASLGGSASGVIFVMSALISAGTIALITPHCIISSFRKDLEVIKIGVSYLRIVYMGLVFVIFPVIFGGVFKGAGDTFPPMISSLIANVVFKLPTAYVLSTYFELGTNGVWIAVSLSVFVEAIVISLYFRLGKWKEK